MQLNHESVPFRNQEFPIILVCDTILFQPNIGSLFRISEAFGVEKNSFSWHRKPNESKKN